MISVQLDNAIIAAQAIEHDADIALGREVPPSLPPDVLHHQLCGGLNRRFFQGGSGLDLRSFRHFDEAPTLLKSQPQICRTGANGEQMNVRSCVAGHKNFCTIGDGFELLYWPDWV